MPRDRSQESPVVETQAGLAPDGDGWFVVNLSDAAAVASEESGYAFGFEAAAARGRTFPHFGINVHVMQPGQAASLYHAEVSQEAFLVLQGECLLIVEDEERTLRQWDFFYSPPWTAHVLVGAGEGPCAVLMVGARNAGTGVVYPVSEAAGRYRASAAEETTSGPDAYGGAGWQQPRAARRPWPPE
jgi:uncharacterized cupin superfamily protein